MKGYKKHPECACGARKDPATGRCTANPSCDDFKRRRPPVTAATPRTREPAGGGSLVDLVRAAERRVIPSVAAGVEERQARTQRGWRTRRGAG